VTDLRSAPDAGPGVRSARAPLAVALDGPDLGTVLSWARATGPHVAVMKVGLETFLRDGALGVTAVREAAPEAGLFLDLKLHDIPNTVAGAARSLAGLAPDILTVHASGGSAMIAAAAQALPRTRIAAVTILTSLSGADLAQIGIVGDARDAAVRLAVLAVRGGARALVCSPLEAAQIRSVVGPDVLLITPGVRPASGTGSELADQARVATPVQALAAGADLLVVGRPITGAADPAAAAAAIAAELVAA
jgi:orotidine-5'-phosphate decarboxylase